MLDGSGDRKMLYSTLFLWGCGLWGVVGCGVVVTRAQFSKVHVATNENYGAVSNSQL